MCVADLCPGCVFHLSAQGISTLGAFNQFNTVWCVHCGGTWRVAATSVKREKNTHTHTQFLLSDLGESSVADEAAAIKSLLRAKKSLSRWQSHPLFGTSCIKLDEGGERTYVKLCCLRLNHHHHCRPSRCHRHDTLFHNTHTRTYSRRYKEALQSGQVSNKSDCV